MFLPNLYDVSETTLYRNDGTVERTVTASLFMGYICNLLTIVDDEIARAFYGGTNPCPSLLPSHIKF